MNQRSLFILEYFNVMKLHLTWSKQISFITENTKFMYYVCSTDVIDCENQ